MRPAPFLVGALLLLPSFPCCCRRCCCCCFKKEHSIELNCHTASIRPSGPQTAIGLDSSCERNSWRVDWALLSLSLSLSLSSLTLYFSISLSRSLSLFLNLFLSLHSLIPSFLLPSLHPSHSLITPLRSTFSLSLSLTHSLSALFCSPLFFCSLRSPLPSLYPFILSLYPLSVCSPRLCRTSHHSTPHQFALAPGAHDRPLSPTGQPGDHPCHRWCRLHWLSHCRSTSRPRQTTRHCRQPVQLF